jgi:hypothetical protein
MIPLHITGNVQLEGLALDTDHYYHVLEACSLDVSENARLVALMLSDFE